MEDIKIGIVGLDTSHSLYFTQLLNNPDDEDHLPGGRVVKAFPGGSEQFSNSIGRVEGFTTQFRDELGIEIVNSIEELNEGVDVFMLESVDGHQHLEQFKILAQYGKPIFIDKPLACCYDDAKAIVELAITKNVPIMTSSLFRYAVGVDGVVAADEQVQTCHTFGPMAILEDYRDYFWYGSHSAEMLFTMMGAGCQKVHVVLGEDYDLLVGVWNDGRIGTITGKRVEPFNFGCSIFTTKGERTTIVNRDISPYKLIMKVILEFFRTGINPISITESLEIIAFLEAASRSRAANGATIILNQL